MARVCLQFLRISFYATSLSCVPNPLLTAILCSYFYHLLDRIDPDSIWLDLCSNSDLADLAKDKCRAFLQAYVRESAETVLVLGPEETASKPTVTSAYSLLNVWRSLIAEADATVLWDKRQKDRLNKDTWRLKFMDYCNRKGQGPVFEISKVSRTPLLLPLHFCSALLFLPSPVLWRIIYDVINRVC